MHPNFIVLMRHGESQLAQEEDLPSRIPDHQIPLTAVGRLQAREAGQKLRRLLELQSETLGVNLLDNIWFHVSPYKRARETFEGVLETLKPRAFRLWEEPRLREQDFGNFQTVDGIRQAKAERHRFGHFYYRFPHGESGADVYDRMSSYLETLHRQFRRPDFPRVIVLVGHGITSRLFLMRWFHWNVDVFESLENLNNCEIVLMKREMEMEMERDVKEEEEAEEKRVRASPGEACDLCIGGTGTMRRHRYKLITPLRRWKNPERTSSL
ncbi:histidine phosphatase superfamily [Zopfochytrium polystomum]|nr:histidine phosphatase superfamily [Zopfochytrium polystomum]